MDICNRYDYNRYIKTNNNDNTVMILNHKFVLVLYVHAEESSERDFLHTWMLFGVFDGRSRFSLSKMKTHASMEVTQMVDLKKYDTRKSIRSW
jgi:hypothetical protein